MDIKKHINNKTLQNSFFTLAIRLAGVAVLFGLTILMTRNIDAKYVGAYDFARVTLLTIATFGLLGTEQAILYFAGKLDAKNNSSQLKAVYYKMLKTVLGISIIILLVYLIIPKSILIYIGLKPNLLSVLTKCFYILPFYVITILNTETIRAFNKVMLSEWFRNIFKYFPIILGSILIIYNVVSVDTLLNWYLYGFVVLAIVTFLIIVLHQNQFYLKDTNIRTSTIINTSYPMAISSFYTYLLMMIDVFLLAQYFDLSVSAYYATAVKIMSILSMVIVAVNINFAPKVAVSYEKKEFSILKKYLSQASKIIASINILLGVLLLSFGNYILNIFGTEYTQALSAYTILIITQIIVSLFGMVPMYMNMTGKQQLFHKIMGCAVVINLICNLILIPRYQMLGAAISYSITVLFWNVMVVFFSYKSDKVILNIWK